MKKFNENTRIRFLYKFKRNIADRYAGAWFAEYINFAEFFRDYKKEKYFKLYYWWIVEFKSSDEYHPKFASKNGLFDMMTNFNKNII